MKRMISVLLILALSAGIHVYAEQAESGTFTVWVQSDAADVSKFPYIEEISKQTGIYPEFIEISPASATERMNLMWASNEYPDVITGGLVTKNDIDTYAQYGVIQPINDLIKDMPNFQKYILDEARELMTAVDGNMYYFPTTYNDYIGLGIYINQKWLDTLNLETPETPDELYEVLIAFRDKDPNGNNLKDEIPFSGEHLWASGVDTLQGMFGAFGRPAGFQVEDGKVIYANIMDSHKEGAKFFRKLYTENLIDKEFFTQDLTSFRAKAQNDPVILGCMISFVASAANRCLTNEMWASGTYQWLLPLKNKEGVRAYDGPNSLQVVPQLIITSACKNPQTVAKWVDYMYDPGVSQEIDQAPLGIGWEIIDGKWHMKTDAPEGYDSVAAWRMANQLQQLPRAMTADALKTAGIELALSPTTTTYDLRKRDAYYLENGVVKQELLPTIAATPEETEVLNTFLPDITKYYTETFANWITGNGDIDAEWDTYVDRMNNMGLDRVLAVYQSQYERAQSSK